MRGLTLSQLLLAASAFLNIASALQRPADDDDDTPLPLIIWHGLGDSYNADGMQRITELAESVNPGTLVYPIQVASDPSKDRTATFLGNVTAQLDKVCADIAAHPILSTAPAIDALGFSQGGLFLRGYVERCNVPPVRSLVTYGSPHNGVSSFRDCEDTDAVCKAAMALLRLNIWSDFVQGKLVPAQYFRDPADYDMYNKNSNFLADVNNEREKKHRKYKNNMAGLVKFVMVMFEEDTTLIPKESAWFEEVNGTVATPLRGRQIYSDDWLGLKELDRKGGLKFIRFPGDHMQFSDALLNRTIKGYFGPMNRQFDMEEPISEEL